MCPCLRERLFSSVECISYIIDKKWSFFREREHSSFIVNEYPEAAPPPYFRLTLSSYSFI